MIERLGRARSVLLDKTGTLTLGTPRIGRVGTAVLLAMVAVSVLALAVLVVVG